MLELMCKLLHADQDEVGGTLKLLVFIFCRLLLLRSLSRQTKIEDQTKAKVQRRIGNYFS